MSLVFRDIPVETGEGAQSGWVEDTLREQREALSILQCGGMSWILGKRGQFVYNGKGNRGEGRRKEFMRWK